MKGRLAILVATAVALGAAPAAAAAPHLGLRSSEPVVVSGSGFRPGETLTVRAAVGGSTRTHHLRASSSGTFRSRFAELHGGGCSARVSITARHNGTLRASFFSPPRECAPRY